MTKIIIKKGSFFFFFPPFVASLTIWLSSDLLSKHAHRQQQVSLQKVTRCGSNERQEWMPQMDPVCVSLRCAVPCHSDSHLQKDTFVEDCDYASKMNYFKQIEGIWWIGVQTAVYIKICWVFFPQVNTGIINALESSFIMSSSDMTWVAGLAVDSLYFQIKWSWRG